MTGIFLILLCYVYLSSQECPYDGKFALVLPENFQHAEDVVEGGARKRDGYLGTFDNRLGVPYIRGRQRAAAEDSSRVFRSRGTRIRTAKWIYMEKGKSARAYTSSRIRCTAGASRRKTGNGKYCRSRSLPFFRVVSRGDLNFIYV